jgi:hypothetical protein
MMSTERSLPGAGSNLADELAQDGSSIIATPGSFPKSALARIQQIADSHPEIEVEVAGGPP